MNAQTRRILGVQCLPFSAVNVHTHESRLSAEVTKVKGCAWYQNTTVAQARRFGRKKRSLDLKQAS